MEGEQFDAITKSLTTGSTRRRVLRGVTGGLAGALAVLLGREAVEGGAKRRRHRQRRVQTEDSPQRTCKDPSRPCSFDTHCCSKVCCKKRCCKAGEECRSGECVSTTTPPPPEPVTCTTPGTTNCGGECVDLTDNPQHCGTCTTVCSPHEDCCAGNCTDTMTDANNCGACLARDGDICTPDPNAERPQGAQCVNGTCQACALVGPIREGGPSTCCRGLTRCSDPETGNECVLAGTPCP